MKKLWVSAFVAMAFVFVVLVGMSIRNARISECVSSLRWKGHTIFRIVSTLSNEKSPEVFWPCDLGINAHTSVEYFQQLLYVVSSTGLGEKLEVQHLSDGWNTIPPLNGGPLTKENVAWTVAKNTGPDIPDVLPILITRNIDVTSLSTNVVPASMDSFVSIDDSYRSAFDRSFALVIYGDGRVMFFRLTKDAKISYREFYRNGSFCVAGLKYITPKGEVSLTR